jgi:mRNA-degrading endonuclease RelE of RelBE toxin-antitoxin system
MAADVVLSLIAIKELEESSDWYEAQLHGLGKRFVGIVKETLITVSLNPETFPKKRKSRREIIVSDFPYVIVYDYDKNENEVNVLHIFHTSRNPKNRYKQK